MRTQYFFFPVVFPFGIKAKKLINIYGRALSFVVLFPFCKRKLVFVCNKSNIPMPHSFHNAA